MLEKSDKMPVRAFTRAQGLAFVRQTVITPNIYHVQ